ncbi:MAG: LptF/LptG family permease [Phycisphaerae bacterium]
MLTTLHSYILRELLRNFLLSVIALSTVLTLGGGLFNVIRYEGITGGDLVRILPWLLPIVITFTMPVAAVFSASMVYGRLAADNELLACRAAGINVHRLFFAAILLAIFVTLFTLIFGNFVIPGFMKRIDRFARANIAQIAYQQLRSKGYIAYARKYFVTGEEVGLIADSALQEKNFPVGQDYSYLALTRPTVLQLNDQGELVRFTSAAWGMCQFDTRDAIRVTLYIRDARDLEIGRRAVQIEQQELGPIDLPLPFPQKPSWMDLNTLVQWIDQPWLADKTGQQTRAFLARLLVQRFGGSCVEQLSGGKTLTLNDDANHRYAIQAAEATLNPNGRASLTRARVVVSREGFGDLTRYEAPQAELIMRPMPEGGGVGEIRLLRTTEKPVLEYKLRSDRPDRPAEQLTVSLDRIVLPDAVREDAARYTPAMAIDPAVKLPIEGPLVDERVGLWAATDQFRRKVAALIHFRLGYAASPIVTIVMAAALGVMFRGARALSAFGLSCIPFAAVTILAIMGRQLAEQSNTATIGPAIIWGGLLACAFANLLMVRVGVKR